MIEPKRFIARIQYKSLNQPTKNVIVVKAFDESTAREIINERYNKDGFQLIEITSIRDINED